MHISELRGPRIRKDLNLDCCFHTLKKDTGFFEIFLITKGNQHFQLNGTVNDGEVTSTRLSKLFKPEVVIKNFDEAAYDEIIYQIQLFLLQ